MKGDLSLNIWHPVKWFVRETGERETVPLICHPSECEYTALLEYLRQSSLLHFPFGLFFRPHFQGQTDFFKYIIMIYNKYIIFQIIIYYCIVKTNSKKKKTPLFVPFFIKGFVYVYREIFEKWHYSLRHRFALQMFFMCLRNFAQYCIFKPITKRALS